MKTKTWILIIAAAAVLCASASAILLGGTAPGRTVEILLDGAAVRRIDLDAVTEPETFTLRSAGGGTNVIAVEPGRIRVLEADCPDLLCVKQGWLSDGVAPIVCLPHRLVIQPAARESADAVSR